MLENAMATRGRPAKILTSNDLMTLQQFLEKLPFLKKNQQQALTLLQQANGIFNDKQLSLLKTADRDKNQFLKRQTLIEQIKLKDKNQQPLLANETEILALLKQEIDQDTFFRLDRALESYQKIEKAALENRIRLENEHKREILHKNHKELTEAQKKRNAENQLKYALGGMLQSLYKDLGFSITQSQIPLLEQALIQTLIWEKTTKNTKIYKAVEHNTTDINEARELFHRILEDISTYKIKEQEFLTVLINKHRKQP
jgi:hypothetical protein